MSGEDLSGGCGMTNPLALTDGLPNPVPGLADWFILGEKESFTPQVAGDAAGWDAVTPATRGLTVIAPNEPTVSDSNTPTELDLVMDCQPNNVGLVHDLSSGDEADVNTWETSSGFIVFRLAAAGSSDQMFAGFASAAGGRWCGIGCNLNEYPMVSFDDNADYYKVLKGTPLSVGPWHTLSFTKSALLGAELWLDKVKQTALTVESNIHGADSWLDDYLASETPEAFSVGCRLTNEGTREYTEDANIQVAAFGWCQAALLGVAHDLIHGYYPLKYGY